MVSKCRTRWSATVFDRGSRLSGDNTSVRDERHNFSAALRRHDIDMHPLCVDTLQVNITKLCNQACRHCHVDASPTRTEQMDRRTIERCLELLDLHPQINTLDITGGAPELHPDFALLVRGAAAIGKRIIVRHNLTVTLDGHPVTGESCGGLPEFFASHRVELVSSLPYYQQYFTDQQRGRGVFEKSIDSLKLLNDAGYGDDQRGLLLNLVYNPVGAFLPAAQHVLEADFKKELFARYGIRFNGLFVITNMPIHRFADQLNRLGTYDVYMEKLVNAFNPAAAAAVMCRSMISVGYDGTLYDCDFNQMLDLSIGGHKALTVFNFSMEELRARQIRLGSHCFGCTAGAGSSCGGETVAS